MVKVTRTKYNTILQKGSFMGLVVPEYKHFVLSLEESIKIGTKDGVEVSKDHSFDLTIQSNINQSYKEKLDNDLKTAFKMNWAPYNYQSKSYRYYTTSYTPNEEKLEKIKNIFTALSEFEIYYNEEIQQSINLFKEDALDKRSYSDYEVAVKYNEEKECFVLVALRYLGKEKYFFFRNASVKSGMLGQSEYKDTGFFDDLVDWSKIKKDVTYFEINPESYLEIRNLVEVKEKEKENFQNEQKTILEKVGKDQLAFFNEENIFGLKIQYSEKEKMFEFYCKGYDEPKPHVFKDNKGDVYTSPAPDRTLIPRLAVNYILSKQLSTEEITKNFEINEDGTYIENNFIEDKDLSILDHQYKYNLTFEASSSKKDKSLFLSLKYNDVLKEIIQNFENNKSFFGRKIKEIKIKNENLIELSSNGNKNSPTIYLNDDGRCFFVLSSRETKEIIGNNLSTIDNKDNVNDLFEEKSNSNENEEIGSEVAVKKVRKIKPRSGSFSMKAIEISHQEALYYLNEHPWAPEIKSNSVYLNSEIWMSNRNHPQINQQEREHSFDILLLNNKIQGETRKNNAEKVKAKKHKI